MPLNELISLRTTKQAFRQIRAWLHTEHFEDSAWVNRNSTVIQSEILDIYIFADEYDMPLLRKDVLEELRTRLQYTEDKPRRSFIVKAFENLPLSSPLIKLLVDRHAHHWGSEEQDTHELPKEFTEALEQARDESNKQWSGRIYEPRCPCFHDFGCYVESFRKMTGGQRCAGDHSQSTGAPGDTNGTDDSSLS